ERQRAGRDRGRRAAPPGQPDAGRVRQLDAVPGVDVRPVAAPAAGAGLRRNNRVVNPLLALRADRVNPLPRPPKGPQRACAPPPPLRPRGDAEPARRRVLRRYEDNQDLFSTIQDHPPPVLPRLGTARPYDGLHVSREAVPHLPLRRPAYALLQGGQIKPPARRR